MSSVVLISILLYQSAAIVFLDGGWVSKGLVMVSLAFHLFVVGTVIFASVRLLCQVKSSQELLYSFKGKCGATHKATKPVYKYICKRLTLKKYTTTRSIVHITIYNKHKHNHHYSDTSSSLELSQSMLKLTSATGSYWNGHIPVAICNFSRKFIQSFVHWKCRSNNANGSWVLSWCHD